MMKLKLKKTIGVLPIIVGFFSIVFLFLTIWIWFIKSFVYLNGLENFFDITGEDDAKYLFPKIDLQKDAIILTVIYDKETRKNTYL